MQVYGYRITLGGFPAAETRYDRAVLGYSVRHLFVHFMPPWRPHSRPALLRDIRALFATHTHRVGGLVFGLMEDFSECVPFSLLSGLRTRFTAGIPP